MVVSFSDSVLPPEAQPSIFLSRPLPAAGGEGYAFCLLKEVAVLGFPVPLAEGASFNTGGTPWVGIG